MRFSCRVNLGKRGKAEVRAKVFILVPLTLGPNVVSLKREGNVCVRTTVMMASEVIMSSRLRREAYHRRRLMGNQKDEKNSEPIIGHAVTTM